MLHNEVKIFLKSQSFFHILNWQRSFPKITLKPTRPQNLGSLLIKWRQSNFNLRSSDSNLFISYLNTTVILIRIHLRLQNCFEPHCVFVHEEVRQQRSRINPKSRALTPIFSMESIFHKPAQLRLNESSDRLKSQRYAFTKANLWASGFTSMRLMEKLCSLLKLALLRFQFTGWWIVSVFQIIL